MSPQHENSERSNEQHFSQRHPFGLSIVSATPISQHQHQPHHNEQQHENLSAVAAAAAIVIGTEGVVTDPALENYNPQPTDPASQTATHPGRPVDTIQTLFCGRCHLHRPYADFFGPPHPEIMKKNCTSCRTKMNLHKRSVERTRNRGREYADIPESHRVSSMGMLKELLSSDLFSVPILEEQSAGDLEAAHAQFKYFVFPDVVFADKRIGEWFSGAKEEPSEIYRFVTKSIMEITGYSFSRHARYTYTRTSGGWSSRYKCGQCTQNASRHVKLTGPKARNVRQRTYYDCKGVLTISGTISGLRIAYDHFHIHTGRMRKPSVKKGDPVFPEDIPTNVRMLRGVAPVFLEQLKQNGGYPSMPPAGFTGFDHPQFIERRKLMMLFFGTTMCKNNRPLQEFLMSETDKLAMVLKDIYEAPAEFEDDSEALEMEEHLTESVGGSGEHLSGIENELEGLEVVAQFNGFT